MHAQQNRVLQHSYSPVTAQCYTRPSRCCKVAAAARPGPLVGLQRLPDAKQATTVVERRAADVAVIGGGIIGALSAYTLARAGRKVLLLSDYGLSAASPQGSPLQPLKLTDTDPLLVHLALESSAYWRGLELLAGTQLLSPQASCDVVLQPDRDHAGAEGFSKLQAACDTAGVTAAPLSCSEAMAQFRQLRLPHSSSCLLQPDGAVLHAGDAGAAARQLAERAGVVSRPGLVLRGWRDRGSCFQLRASSRLAPELLSLFEAEVLLLAPSHWPVPCLGLFGLELSGLQV
ncbi:FAD dependent oxidoreductase-domain-containing protein [Scenedesmus sp. NREL 46B-D3]|nr:FAD dependent oxidoreductase-domain-containing protein [Scenedesmus sp. NREL 46B-D3]